MYDPKLFCWWYALSYHDLLAAAETNCACDCSPNSEPYLKQGGVNLGATLLFRFEGTSRPAEGASLRLL